MRRVKLKGLVISAALMALAIFYGIDVATSGIGQVYGTIPDSYRTPVSYDTGQTGTYGDLPLVAPVRQNGEFGDEQAFQLEEGAASQQWGLDGNLGWSDPAYGTELDDPVVTHLANSTGQLLQQAAKYGMDKVVSLFDAFLN